MYLLLLFCEEGKRMNIKKLKEISRRFSNKEEEKGFVR